MCESTSYSSTANSGLDCADISYVDTPPFPNPPPSPTYIVQDFPSEANCVNNSTSIVQPTMHGACMFIENAQSKRGRRKRYWGVRLPYAVVVRHYFSCRAAILSSSSSSSSSRSIAAEVIAGRCYNSNNTGTWYIPVVQHTWYKYRALYCCTTTCGSFYVFHSFIQITLSGNVINSSLLI